MGKHLFHIVVLLLMLPAPASGQKFSVSTNVMGYLNFGTMNLEASYALSQHWSLNVGARFNPFSFQLPGRDTQMQNRQQSYNAGVRLWPWHIFSGWWIAGKLQYQEYNRGGIVSAETEEGDGVGIGLSAGYTYMLHPNLNLEFGIGLWSGVKRYTVYDCPVCGLTTESGTKAFIMPNDLIISIAYVF